MKNHAHICKILKLTEMVSQVLKDPELFFKKQNENYKMSEKSKLQYILLPQYFVKIERLHNSKMLCSFLNC